MLGALSVASSQSSAQLKPCSASGTAGIAHQQQPQWVGKALQAMGSKAQGRWRASVEPEESTRAAAGSAEGGVAGSARLAVPGNADA